MKKKLLETYYSKEGKNYETVSEWEKDTNCLECEDFGFIQKENGKVEDCPKCKEKK